MKYNHKKIEKKWQKVWQKKKIYKTSDKSKNKKCYVLDMFPYPSGEGLHVGHPKGYIATDVYSRHKKMNGFNIMHPMGWDAFGLPAENYAIKNKIHPEIAVKKNVKTFKKQLQIIGFNYDWEREINTTEPEYYKWTQWIFLKLYEKGLAYESYEPINWCPSCETGLANEDLENGACERCGSIVEKRPMRQWLLKITDYAEKLLEELDSLNWPESIKESQRNWIGKSEGLLFESPVKDTNLTIKTFSTHFEAFYADTFVVIAPDHLFLKKLVEGTEKEKEVLKFSKKLTEERLKEKYGIKELKGIFTGRYIIDPVGNGDLPIWVANYVISDYGTGIVKASCHDERDFSFAKKYNIKLKPVVFPEDPNLRKTVENLETCYPVSPEGILKEPSGFAGEKIGEVRDKIADFAVRKGFAQRKVSYRLNDWVFSRQRYWGEPIPIIHCEKCGIQTVPEKDLPVKLPKVKSYAPTGTGESPLATIDSWVNVKCPKCKGKAKRETNTMPQWAGSSWYYLRYIDPNNKRKIFDQTKEQYWLPVDLYVGGAEHATRHLIYSRFWHKFLYDLGFVSTKEPFDRLEHVGLIMAEDGRKMSKRYGNVINPDNVVETWGADTLRIYEMFMGPFSQQITWNTDSMMGSRRFLERVWRIGDRVIHSRSSSADSRLESLLHKTIKKVGEDIESFNFNTAVSAMMILSNELEKQEEISGSVYKTFLKLLAPFAPHITEELWNRMGEKKSIHLSMWPNYDLSKIKDILRIALQVNGKTADILELNDDLSEKEIEKLALSNDKVKIKTKNKKIINTIYIKNKILNFVAV